MPGEGGGDAVGGLVKKALKFLLLLVPGLCLGLYEGVWWAWQAAKEDW